MESVSLHITVVVASSLLFIAFISSIYHRLRLANFVRFSSLTLTNKYFFVSVGAGATNILFILAGYLLYSVYSRLPTSYLNLISFLGVILFNVMNWTCAITAIFAAIHRYERIAMILRGTKRFRVLQAFKAISITLAILSGLSFLAMFTSANLQVGQELVQIFISVYATVTCLSVAYVTMLDLALGVRMVYWCLNQSRRIRLSKI